ncbi:peptidoglycan-binding domain-containing protein [Roseovarius dicentrarchi]|uniref:peptidoglycan-binding domain-containing protein n=1 Tax=Roseovarius dicentrarchi TaxID=2250573 RepID=UPI0013966E34|nr:peptidoglycan-binding domain-containing protein [Roseovarius dicentrarchi]
MRHVYSLGLAVLLLLPALVARADNVALIYGDSGQSPFFQSGDSVAPGAFSEPLIDAGFTVIEPSRRDAAAMRRAAQQVQKMLDDDQVERLLIVVYGPFASNARDNWALSNDAVSASNITIGATGISVNALSDMADRSGRGVVMLAPGRLPTSLGSGLVPGLGDITSVGNVTYLTGSTEALAAVVTDGLLEAGRSYAALAAALPSGVRMTGYVPADTGFMGEAAAEGGEQMRQAGYWQAIRDVDTIEAYRLYLRAYPGAANRAVAQERITFLQGAPERMARAAEDALNLSDAARRGIQRDLKTLDLYKFGIDGRFGKGSRSAIAAWQRGQGFDETGYLSGNQLIALRSDAKERGAQIARQEAEAKEKQEREDRAYWQQSGKDGTEAGLRAYLGRYPAGAFAAEARASLAAIEDARKEEDTDEAEKAERRAWQAAKAGDTPGDYIDYLNTYPKGRYAARARQQLDAFQGEPDGADAIARAQSEEGEITGSGISRFLIEKRLEQAGAQPGPVDGRFDAQTREAIRWYQDSRALPVTGYLSRATMLRLMAGR